MDDGLRIGIDLMIPDKLARSQLPDSSPLWARSPLSFDNVMLHPTEWRPHRNAKPLPISERARRGLSPSI